MEPEEKPVGELEREHEEPPVLSELLEEMGELKKKCLALESQNQQLCTVNTQVVAANCHLCHAC